MRFFQCLAMVAMVALTGCAGFEAPPADFDYGSPPRLDVVRPEIERRTTDRLIDPESARFRFNSGVSRGYLNNGLMHGGRIILSGWILTFEVNAKNRMGGYTGFQPYFCIVRNNAVQGCMSGYPRDNVLITVLPDGSAIMQ
jgi:hypothetical protein